MKKLLARLGFAVISAILLFQFTHDCLYAQLSYPVRVVSLKFKGGGGIGPTSAGNYYSNYYYRAYGAPGTVCQLSAEMNVAGSWLPMYGDTQFTLSYSDGVSTGSFFVTVLSGHHEGLAVVPYSAAQGFPEGWIGAGTTPEFTYTVTAASGTYCSGFIASAPAASIYWDRNTPPTDAVFPPVSEADVILNTTASTCKFFWRPITALTNATYQNGDFYEYRIRYRIYNEEDPQPWRLWSGTNDPSLRFIANNPVANPGTDTSLHFYNSRKYTTLPNLKLFTRYEYYIEAVDVFGNVSDAPAVFYAFSTLPYSTTMIVSDGISSYSDFTDLANPQSRSLRDSNIRVDMTVVATDTLPDSVKVWYTAIPATDILLDAKTVNTGAFAEETLYSAEALATGPNRWTAYLSSESNAIAIGNTVRMIVETNVGGVSSFADYDISDLDANDDEWTVYIGTQSTFTPWPVRILNNVLTKENPVAYPSYYLSEDAYVSIMVYDIKGRTVATVLDNAFRRGGQNIKENGWRGTNKTGRKLGVGMYYIKIFARSAATKKVVLDKTEKVVIAY